MGTEWMILLYHKGLQLDDDEYLTDYGCGPEELNEIDAIEIGLGGQIRVMMTTEKVDDIFKNSPNEL